MEQREDHCHAAKRAKAELSKEDELKLLREEVAHLEKKVSENKLKILGTIFSFYFMNVRFNVATKLRLHFARFFK